MTTACTARLVHVIETEPWLRLHAGCMRLAEFAQIDCMGAEFTIQIANDTTVGDERKLGLFEILIGNVKHFLDAIANGRKALALFHFNEKRYAKHSLWILIEMSNR